MKSPRKKKLRNLLTKCWMTHDGMWFYHCVKQCGIEKANAINKAGIRSLVAFEVDRIEKAFGLKSVESLADLEEFFLACKESVIGDFMEFDFQFLPEGALEVEAHRCFAYEGLERIGAIDWYECGVFERIDCWLDKLGVRWHATPAVERCMMHEQGRCFRHYDLFFKGPSEYDIEGLEAAREQLKNIPARRRVRLVHSKT